MTQAPVLPTGREIEDRTARCHVLREAWHALTLCAAVDTCQQGSRRIGEINAALVVLGDHVRSAQAAGPSDDAARLREAQSLRDALRDIDGRLARETAGLLDTLDHCASAERHQDWLALPIGQAARDGVTMLLDLVLEDEAGLASRLSILEDLILLLATDEQQGSRRVVRDPTTLTARLRAVCDRTTASAGSDPAATEAILIAAARRCEDEPAESIAREVEGYRQALGRGLLVPRILRALIFFDAALWSRLTANRKAAPVRAADTADAPLHSPEPVPPSEVVPAPQAAAVVPVPGVAARNADDGRLSPQEPETIRWRLDERPTVLPPPPPRRRLPRLRTLRRLAAAVVITSSAGFSLMSWTGAAATIRSVPRSQLQAVSAGLDSGYRGQRGTGPLFIGTVTTDWELLSPKQREHRAWRIIDQLTATGVREILLYGAEHRLALHYADGLPVRITP